MKIVPVGTGRMGQAVEALAPEGIRLSVISLAELYEGVFNSTDPAGNERALLEFISDVDLVPPDEETCRIFGRERRRLRRAGRMIGDMDLFIAATCLRHNLTLLSNNRRHFEAVQGLEIISIDA